MRLTLLLITAPLLLGGSPVTAQGPAKQAVKELQRLGATVFLKGEDVVEVHANRCQVTDQDLQHVAGCAIFDLQSEELMKTGR